MVVDTVFKYTPTQGSVFYSCSQCGMLHIQGDSTAQCERTIKEGTDMASINLDGGAPEGSLTPRPKLQHEERYPAVFEKCRVQEVKDFETGKPVNKIILDWIIKEGKTENTVPMWVNPKVSKGSGSYSNSTLYDILERLGILANFAKDMKGKSDIPDQELSDWIEKNLKGMKATVEVRNRKIGTEEEYSNVGKVLKPVK